jgi:hypothetical protein
MSHELHELHELHERSDVIEDDHGLIFDVENIRILLEAKGKELRINMAFMREIDNTKNNVNLVNLRTKTYNKRNLIYEQIGELLERGETLGLCQEDMIHYHYVR